MNITGSRDRSRCLEVLAWSNTDTLSGPLCGPCNATVQLKVKVRLFLSLEEMLLLYSVTPAS